MDLIYSESCYHPSLLDHIAVSHLSLFDILLCAGQEGQQLGPEP